MCVTLSLDILHISGKKKKGMKIVPYLLIDREISYLVFLTPGPDSWCVCSKHLERILSSDNQGNGKQFKVGNKICDVSGEQETEQQMIQHLLA